jgi:integrase
VAFVEKIPAGPRRPERYRVRYRDPAGRHRSRTFRRRRDAEDFARRVEIQIADGAWRDPTAARRPLGELAEAYFAGAYDLRRASRVLYEGSWRRHIAPTFAETPVGGIRPEDVRAWVDGLLRSGLGPRTVQVARQVLGRILQRAVEDGLIRTNPVRAVRPPAAAPKETRVPTTAEVEAVAEAIEPRYRAMVLVAAYAGLRLGEVAGLQRRDLRLLERRVDVRRQVTEVRGVLEVGPLKTATSRRTVPIPAFLAEELAAHLAAYTAPEPDAFVFTGPGGGPVRRATFRTRYFDPAIKAAGVEPFTFHALRDHAATAAIRAGADVKVVQRMLGHVDAALTLNRYAAYMPDAAELVAERLEEIRAQARARAVGGGRVVALERR